MGILDRFKKTKRNPDLEERLSGTGQSGKTASKADSVVPKKVLSASDSLEKRDEQNIQKSAKKHDTTDSKALSRAKHGILLAPLVSEKATGAEKTGAYTFKVARRANKMEIKNAVKSVYGVEPLSVRTMMFQGKNMRFGGNHGKRSDWKKAVVTLPKGTVISIHEGV